MLWLKLLTTTKLPHIFWAESIITIDYIQNYCYTSLILDKTPFELWVSMQPDLCHLCAFKCPTYEHVLNEKQQKLDSKTQKCIFVDYVESPNPHHHHKIICMMFPRSGFPLYHFTLLLLLYFQTQLLYPPCQYNTYIKHHFHSWNLLLILFHPLVNTLNMISIMIHSTNLFLPFQVI